MAGKLFKTRRSVILFIMTIVCIFSTYLLLFEVEVTRHCHRLCNGDLNGPCYKKNYAVMIYKDGVPVDEMSFEQSVLPKLTLSELLREFTTGKISHENCVIQEYYPSTSTVDRQKSCAIVGNGGIILNSGCGDEINSHDFVMRANLAPIKPFANDVGLKTNLTILNYESLHTLYHSLYTLEYKLDHHDELLRRLKFLNDSIVWFAKSMNYKDTRTYLRSVAHVLKNHFSMPIKLAYTWQSVSIEKYWGLEHYASSGFNLFAVAQTFCSEITLYGFYPFDKDENNHRLRHHYYDSKPSEFFTKVHNIPAEYRKLKQLHDEKKIQLVIGQCRSSDQRIEPIRRAGDNETMVNPVELFSSHKIKISNEKTNT